MTTAIILVFIAGYLLIAFENVTLISKTAVALLMAVACWALYYIGFGASSEVVQTFTRTLGETSEILFFLLGNDRICFFVYCSCIFRYGQWKEKRGSRGSILTSSTTCLIRLTVANKGQIFYLITSF